MAWSSTFKWLEFVTTYILVLFTHEYMACDGSSRLSVKISVHPRWDSLLGVNWDKILCYLSSFLMNKFLARTNMTWIERVSVFVMFYQELELEMRSYNITIRVCVTTRTYRSMTGTREWECIKYPKPIVSLKKIFANKYINNNNFKTSLQIFFFYNI